VATNRRHLPHMPSTSPVQADSYNFHARPISYMHLKGIVVSWLGARSIRVLELDA
jgi:hypothetical protein